MNIKNILILMSVGIGLSASDYVGQLKPFQEFTLNSETQGLITKIDTTQYGSKANIKIDSKNDLLKINNLKSKLKILNEKINLKEIEYKNIKSINSKSLIEKNNKLIAILDLKMNKEDLDNQISDLEYILSKKNININNLYIKDILVYENQVININTPLLKLENHTKSKLDFYVDFDLSKKIELKNLIIQDSKGENVIFDEILIDKNTDEKYISQYKVSLLSKDYKEFGQILNVKVKND